MWHLLSANMWLESWESRAKWEMLPREEPPHLADGFEGDGTWEELWQDLGGEG